MQNKIRGLTKKWISPLSHLWDPLQFQLIRIILSDGFSLYYVPSIIRCHTKTEIMTRVARHYYRPKTHTMTTR